MDGVAFGVFRHPARRRNASRATQAQEREHKMKTGFASTIGTTNINRTGLALRSRGVRRRIAVSGLAIAAFALMSATTAPGAVFSPCVANDEEVTLTANTTINVPAGQTKHIEFLLGGNYTITKTGAGRLEIGIVTNTSVKFDVQAGTLAFPNPRTITLTNTVLHLDASLASSLVTTSAGGTNFVTRWNDADGGSLYATTRSGRPNPFVARKHANGFDVVDFGSLYCDSPEVEENFRGVLRGGYGAAMDFSSKVQNTWDYLWAAADYEGTKNLISGSITNIPGPTVLGNKRNQANRGRGCNGVVPMLFDEKVGANTGWHYNYTLNGTGASWSTRPTEQSNGIMNCLMHYGAKNTVQELHGLGFGKGTYDNVSWGTYGGLRIGEIFLFNRRLQEAERLLLNVALIRKWNMMAINSVTVASGATLSLAGHRTIVSTVTIADGGRLELVLDSDLSQSSFTRASTLKLNGGGALAIDARAVRPSDFGTEKRSFNLFTFPDGGASGSLAGWSVETSGGNIEFKGEFSKSRNLLSVSLEKKKGTVVLFR